MFFFHFTVAKCIFAATLSVSEVCLVCTPTYLCDFSFTHVILAGSAGGKTVIDLDVCAFYIYISLEATVSPKYDFVHFIKKFISLTKD